MHNHDHCTHSELKHCSKCDLVYCTKCNKEWGSSVWIPNVTYTTGGSPWWNTATTGYGNHCGNCGSD